MGENLRKITVVFIAIILIVASCAVIAGIQGLKDNRKTSVVDVQEGGKAPDDQSEVFEVVGWDYSQNDLLKALMSKLDLRGGTVTDNNNRQFVITQAHKIELYQDLVIAYNSDLGEYYMFDVHDIRFIRVN